MAAVTRPEPDMDEITQLISMDVTLTFSLLKLVNSAYFALPNKVQSIKQALLFILGLGQLKQWIYPFLSFAPDGGVSDELIKTSFLRGTFCQELSAVCESVSGHSTGGVPARHVRKSRRTARCKVRGCA